MRRHLVSVVASVLLLSGARRVWASEPLPAQFELPRMKTSIYIGSVTLITGVFTLSSDTYTATYEAKVSPWAFWSEAGAITLRINPDDYDRLLRGETIEISGEARNGKGKLRPVTARAQPADARRGTIKVRVAANGTHLIFNGTYEVLAPPAAVAATAAP